MKNLFYLSLLSFTILCSCGGKYYEDKESLMELKEELDSQFGKDAYYTQLFILDKGHDKGSMISVRQTNDPSSLKMRDWTKDGVWQQTSDVTLELPEGEKAEDYMFQLGKQVKFDIMGQMLEDAKNKVIEEKGMKDIRVKSITIAAPDDGDFESMVCSIDIEPKSGGTTFSFMYNMDGTLKDFSY